MQFLQSISDVVSVGETVMHWYNGDCLLSEVVGKGSVGNKHALVVLVNGVQVFVTEIV